MRTVWRMQVAVMTKALIRGIKTCSVVSTQSASNVSIWVNGNVKVYQQVSVGTQTAKAAYLILRLHLS